MIAVWAVILALAGAPSNVGLRCDPSIAGRFEGYADLAAQTAVLAPDACGGVFISSMRSGRARDRVQELNPEALGSIQGRGLLVALHEARHLHGEYNECRAERFAAANVGTLIRRFVPLGDRDAAAIAARQLDASLGAEYHTGCGDP